MTEQDFSNVPWSGDITPAAVVRQHGGARAGAGRYHEHLEYLLVEVVDYYGDKDVLIAGALLNRNGLPSKTVARRAESIAAHHVGEQAQSVRIVKRYCCTHSESELVKVVK